MGKKKCRIRQIFDHHVTVRSKGSTINRFKDFLRKRYFEFLIESRPNKTTRTVPELNVLICVLL